MMDKPHPVNRTSMIKRIKHLAPALLLTVVVSTLSAQQSTVTTADYARAESMLAYATVPLIDRARVGTNFETDGHFWYTVLTPTGREYVSINPDDGSRTVMPISELSRRMTPKGGLVEPDNDVIE